MYFTCEVHKERFSTFQALKDHDAEYHSNDTLPTPPKRKVKQKTRATKPKCDLKVLTPSSPSPGPLIDSTHSGINPGTTWLTLENSETMDPLKNFNYDDPVNLVNDSTSAGSTLVDIKPTLSPLHFSTKGGDNVGSDLFECETFEHHIKSDTDDDNHISSSSSFVVKMETCNFKIDPEQSDKQDEHAPSSDPDFSPDSEDNDDSDNSDSDYHVSSDLEMDETWTPTSNSKAESVPQLPLTDTSLKCPFCICTKKPFKNMSGLKTHIRYKHKAATQGNTNASSTNGSRIPNPTISDGDTQLGFKCPRCSRSFTCKQSLAVHAIIHTRRFICRICGQRFTKRYTRKLHFRMCKSRHLKNELNEDEDLGSRNISLDTMRAHTGELS